MKIIILVGAVRCTHVGRAFLRIGDECVILIERKLAGSPSRGSPRGFWRSDALVVAQEIEGADESSSADGRCIPLSFAQSHGDVNSRSIHVLGGAAIAVAKNCSPVWLQSIQRRFTRTVSRFPQ